MGLKRDAQKNLLFRVRFRVLRYSKNPANAHETKDFSVLGVECMLQSSEGRWLVKASFHQGLVKIKDKEKF
ncbi:hypothetical protein DXD97_03200 [Ruminococcus sp. TM10-9AT]|nr:hypothetical protein DXD97_03200 [Ruminococcus sp. TM10-9AT]